MPWNDEQKIEFCDGIERLLAPQLNDPEVMKQCREGTRGPHFACILGHAQQYRKVISTLPLLAFFLTFPKTPEISLWDRDNRDAVLEFQALPSVRNLMWVA